MFLISTKFQGARSKHEPDKPGKVYIKVSEQSADAEGRAAIVYRTFNTGVSARDKADVKNHVPELLGYVRAAYRVIEELQDTGDKFTIDDVAARLRDLYAGGHVDSVADDDRVWHNSVATLGNEFKPYFTIYLAPRHRAEAVDGNEAKEYLLAFMNLLASEYREEGRSSSSSSYVSTRNSLAKYLNDRDVRMSAVDREFVERYADWILANGTALSTQAFYLRTLRAALNNAREHGLIKGGGNLFAGLNTKVNHERIENGCRLDRKAMLRIADLNLGNDRNLELARDMFMFAFYCQGMELTDVMNLKVSDIRDGVLTYHRRGIGTVRSVALDKSAMAIVGKYNRGDAGNYIFPLRRMYSGQVASSVKYKVALWLKEVGRLAGVASLSFSMNITVCQQLMAHVDLSELLLGNG